MDFHHHRITDAAGHLDCFLRRTGGLRPGDRNLVGVQQRFRDVLRENIVPFGENRVEQAPHAPAIEAERQRNFAGGFVQSLQVAGIRDQVHERADRLFRRLVSRNAGLGQNLHAVGDRVSAHPCRENRLVALARHGADRLGRAGGIGHGLGRENHQDGIDTLVRQDDFKGFCITVGGSIAQNVHGISVRPTRGETFVELGDRLVGQRRQFAFAFDQLVGGHDARPAGVGDDQQSIALGRALVSQNFSTVEHVFDVEDAFDAGALENGLINGIDAGHGAGVGGGGFGRLGETPGFESHNRFGAGERTARRHELAGLGDGFDVEDDGLGIGGGAEIIDEVGHAHVEHIAHGNEIGEADARIDGPIEDRGA